MSELPLGIRDAKGNLLSIGDQVTFHHWGQMVTKKIKRIGATGFLTFENTNCWRQSHLVEKVNP